MTDHLPDAEPISEDRLRDTRAWASDHWRNCLSLA